MRGQREPIYKLARTVLPPVVRFWVRLECSGFASMAPSGPVIVASNHISYFDPLCLGTCLVQASRTVRFLAKDELFSGKWVGWALKGAGQIPVRRATRDAKLALEHAVRARGRRGGGRLPRGDHHQGGLLAPADQAGWPGWPC